MTKPALTVVLTAAEVDGLKSPLPSQLLIDEANAIARLRVLADDLVQEMVRLPALDRAHPRVTDAIAVLGNLGRHWLDIETDLVGEIARAQWDEDPVVSEERHPAGVPR